MMLARRIVDQIVRILAAPADSLDVLILRNAYISGLRVRMELHKSASYEAQILASPRLDRLAYRMMRLARMLLRLVQ